MTIRTPEQFKAARLKLELTENGLARILGVTDRVVRLWESGKNKGGPNPIACRVLQWMLDGFRPPEFDLGADQRYDGRSKRWQAAA